MVLEISQQEKILEAAYTVIAREGYVRTSLRQIAQEAQVAVSQISYYYENKEGLLLAVARGVANKYYDYMQLYLRPEMTPREKGECFINLYREVLEDDPDLFRVLYDLVGLALWSEPVRKQVRGIFQDIMDQITEDVFTKEFVSELKFTPSRSTLASLFFSGIFGIGVQSLLEPGDKTITGSLDALGVVVFNMREVKLS